ncbi:MAG TPA: hypothetical protein VIZ86_16755 [Pseudomonas sp.]
MASTIKDNWSGGIDNLAPADRLPQPSRADSRGFLRNALNVDPTPGGQLHLRSGYELVYSGAAVRGVLKHGRMLLIADGTDLVEFDTRTNSHRVLRQIAGAGQFVGDVLNGILYFATGNELLQYDGRAVKPWGVPDVRVQPLPLVGAGSLRSGHYRLAVTFSDADGLEGGTDAPLIFAVPEAGGLTVTLPEPPAGCVVNLYVSAGDSETLYLQDSSDTAKVATLTALRDDTRLLTTTHLIAPLGGTRIRAHGAQLAIAKGSTVWLTCPMRPHLIDPRRGFFQYPAPVGDLLSAGPWLYVSADKGYAVAGAASDAPEQRVVDEFPCLPGSAVLLPDGRGAWMTRYGQAITTGDGGMELVNRAHYAPPLGENGAAGVIEHNGNQLIVTTTRGLGGTNPRAASDYATWE